MVLTWHVCLEETRTEFQDVTLTEPKVQCNSLKSHVQLIGWAWCPLWKALCLLYILLLNPWVSTCCLKWEGIKLSLERSKKKEACLLALSLPSCTLKCHTVWAISVKKVGLDLKSDRPYLKPAWYHPALEKSRTHLSLSFFISSVTFCKELIK